MEFMPHSNIPVNTTYSPGHFEAGAIWPHTVFMRNLRQIRQQKGLSQVELAEMVGCSQGMISKIEKGQANPTLDLIEAIAQALDTSPASVFGLPELQQRALDAIERLDPDIRASALAVLEKMAAK
jgi:transcriptional regulator with XRE-family HTH domain